MMKIHYILKYIKTEELFYMVVYLNGNVTSAPVIKTVHASQMLTSMRFYLLNTGKTKGKQTNESVSHTQHNQKDTK